MISFSEISITDKRLFDNYIGAYNPKGSEFTFTNFFMWRNLYHFRFTEVEGFLCVLVFPDGKEPYALSPIGKLSQEAFAAAVSKLDEYFKEKNWKPVFKKVQQEDLCLFRELGLGEEKLIPDRDNSDYVYSSSDLIGLKGKKFDGKRNHINRFKREHSFEYVGLNVEHIAECKRIMEEWCKARDCDCQKGSSCERNANIELLDNYEALDLKGAMISVDGRFEAFTVGEMLNKDTAVIHIEKANSGINGLYPLINQQFCEHEWSDALFVNREQDLGQEGLRRAKLSYNPVALINK